VQSENVAKIALNAKLPKFEGSRSWESLVAENDGGKRFTASFKADVILCMHRKL